MTETVAEVLAGPNLATCSGAYWSAFARGFEHGCGVGYELALAEADAAEQAMWDEAVRRVHAVAKAPSHRVLCERRGEPDRAERAREHERRLGLAS